MSLLLNDVRARDSPLQSHGAEARVVVRMQKQAWAARALSTWINRSAYLYGISKLTNSTQWDILLGTRMTRTEADEKAQRKAQRDKDRIKAE